MADLALSLAPDGIRVNIVIPGHERAGRAVLRRSSG